MRGLLSSFSVALCLAVVGVLSVYCRWGVGMEKFSNQTPLRVHWISIVIGQCGANVE